MLSSYALCAFDYYTHSTASNKKLTFTRSTHSEPKKAEKAQGAEKAYAQPPTDSRQNAHHSALAKPAPRHADKQAGERDRGIARVAPAPPH